MPAEVSGANVNLSALTIGSISLDPTFAAGTTAYTAETSNATNAITATAADENTSKTGPTPCEMPTLSLRQGDFGS